jgi:hypothetical protein
MKLINNTSTLCWSCTGVGCKVCNGTGELPEIEHRRWLVDSIVSIENRSCFPKPDYLVTGDRKRWLEKKSTEELKEILQRKES